jgi:hypothetical protein
MPVPFAATFCVLRHEDFSIRDAVPGGLCRRNNIKVGRPSE